MKYKNEVAPRLSTGELSAIETLKGAGWSIMVSPKIESAFSEVGDRYRSFSMAGRYGVAIARKHLGDVLPVVPVQEVEAPAPAVMFDNEFEHPVFFEPEDAIEPEVIVKKKHQRRHKK